MPANATPSRRRGPAPPAPPAARRDLPWSAAATSDPDDGLGRRSARSAAAMLAGSWGRLAINLAGTILLARLLDPDQFGLMAMALTVLLFVGALSDFGLSHALVQHEALDARTAAGLFRLNRRLALWLALALAASGPVMALVYGRREVIPLTLAVAGAVGVGSLLNPYVALMRRQFRFAALAAGETAGLLLATLAAIAAARWGAGTWALVIQFAGQYVAAPLLAWRWSQWHPLREPEWATPAELAPLRRFARDVTAARLLGNVGRNSDTLLVGMLGGAGVLGLYQKSYQWSVLPAQQVAQPMLTVAVSALSRLQHGEAERYRSAVRRALLLMLSVTLPMSAFLLVEARPVILLLLGEKWLAAVPLFRLLCLVTLSQSMYSATKWVYLSEGRTAQQLRWTLVSTPAMLAAIGAGAVWGATRGSGEMAVAWGTAAGFLGGSLLLMVPGTWYCARGGRLRAGDFWRPAWRPAAAAALGLALVLLAADWRLPGEFGRFRPAARLFADAAAFGIVYLGGWLALPGGWRAMISCRQTVRPPRSIPLSAPTPAAEIVKAASAPA